MINCLFFSLRAQSGYKLSFLSLDEIKGAGLSLEYGAGTNAEAKEAFDTSCALN